MLWESSVVVETASQPKLYVTVDLREHHWCVDVSRLASELESWGKLHPLVFTLLQTLQEASFLEEGKLSQRANPQWSI